MGRVAENGLIGVYGEKLDVLELKNHFIRRGKGKLLVGKVSLESLPVIIIEPKDLVDLPESRNNYQKPKERDNFPEKRPLYLKKDTIKMLMDRTGFTGDESKFLQTLVVFTEETKILFEKGDKPKILLLPAIAHKVKPIDDQDVPFGLNLYQFISSFVYNDKIMARVFARYSEDGGNKIRNINSGEYFFADPNQIESTEVFLSSSNINKNGWEKIKTGSKKN